MRFEIVTIFADFFRGPLDYGIVRRAQNAGLIDIAIHDLRDATEDRHRTVDDRPFGGGEGMLLKPEPLFQTVEGLGVAPREKRLSGEARESVVLLSASGVQFTQRMAEELSKLERVVFVCGRYEGVDERVAEQLADREVCVGDFVLSGGELGAALMLDAITRLLPGALGNQASSKTESFSQQSSERQIDDLGRLMPDSTAATGGLLDAPHYTRPAEFRGWTVPEVLLQGNHDEIRRWRRRRQLEKTLRNRPDLLEKVALSAEDKALLREMKREAARD